MISLIGVIPIPKDEQEWKFTSKSVLKAELSSDGGG